MLVSAFFMPGAGQCMQGRWVAGIFYAVTFLTTAVMMLIYIFKILTIYYGVWLETSQDSDVEKVNGMVTPLFAWAIGTTIIYLINIFDAWFAHTRALQRWINARRRAMMPPPLPPA